MKKRDSSCSSEEDDDCLGYFNLEKDILFGLDTNILKQIQYDYKLRIDSLLDKKLEDYPVVFSSEEKKHYRKRTNKIKNNTSISIPYSTVPSLTDLIKVEYKLEIMTYDENGRTRNDTTIIIPLGENRAYELKEIYNPANLSFEVRRTNSFMVTMADWWNKNPMPSSLKLNINKAIKNLNEKRWSNFSK